MEKEFNTATFLVFTVIIMIVITILYAVSLTILGGVFTVLLLTLMPIFFYMRSKRKKISKYELSYRVKKFNKQALLTFFEISETFNLKEEKEGYSLTSNEKNIEETFSKIRLFIKSDLYILIRATVEF